VKKNRSLVLNWGDVVAKRESPALFFKKGGAF
jgi:hypothetical protein